MYLFHYSITHSICFLISFKAKQIAALLEYLKQVLLPWMLLTVFGFTEESSSHSRCFGFKVSSRFGRKRSPKISNYSTEGSGSCSPELIQKPLWSLGSSRRVLDYRSVYHLCAWVSDVPQQTTLHFTSVTPCPTQLLTIFSEESPFLLFQLPNFAGLLLRVREGGVGKCRFRFSSGRSENFRFMRWERKWCCDQGHDSTLTKCMS